MEFNMRVQGLSRFRRAVVIGAAAALAVGVAGCSNSEEASSESSTTAASSQTRVFEAQNGSIEIPSDPQRIVACGYAVLPLIQAGANLAAVCEWTRELGNMDDKTKAAYEALPKVAPDGNVSQLNYEGIVAAEPDLIIMGVPARVESQLDMAQLEAAAPVVFLGPTVPADWRVLGEQFADAANVSDTYGEFKDDYDAKTAELAAKYKDKLGS
ncbi:MAG: ABC transporter substrate-binding protein, partial [Rhodococcus sp.]|nr:ABC transporter substrate-binding protein [Rhodococcus sp. (in: high G+C Gram-positive bacteria)]